MSSSITVYRSAMGASGLRQIIKGKISVADSGLVSVTPDTDSTNQHNYVHYKAGDTLVFAPQVIDHVIISKESK